MTHTIGTSYCPIRIVTSHIKLNPFFPGPRLEKLLGGGEQSRVIIARRIRAKILTRHSYAIFKEVLKKGWDIWLDPLLRSKDLPYHIVRAYEEKLITLSTLSLFFEFWGMVEDYYCKKPLNVLPLFLNDGSPNPLAWDIVKKTSKQIRLESIDGPRLPFENDLWITQDDIAVLQLVMRKMPPHEQVVFLVGGEWTKGQHSLPRESLEIDSILDRIGFVFLSRFEDLNLPGRLLKHKNEELRTLPTDLDEETVQELCQSGCFRLIAPASLRAALVYKLFGEGTPKLVPQFGMATEKELIRMVGNGYSPLMLPNPWKLSELIDGFPVYSQMPQSHHDTFHWICRASIGKEFTKWTADIAERLLGKVKASSVAAVIDTDFALELTVSRFDQSKRTPFMIGYHTILILAEDTRLTKLLAELVRETLDRCVKMNGAPLSWI